VASGAVAAVASSGAWSSAGSSLTARLGGWGGL